MAVTSIRERIMVALVALFQDQRQALPTGTVISSPTLTAAFDFRWDEVRRAVLNDGDKRARRAIGITEGAERKIPQVGTRRCLLPVALEIHVRPEARDEPATFVNQVLENIYRLVSTNGTLGGLCDDIEYVSDDVDVEGYTDRAIEVMVELEVNYKHAETDWREIIPGTGAPA